MVNTWVRGSTLLPFCLGVTVFVTCCMRWDDIFSYFSFRAVKLLIRAVKLLIRAVKLLIHPLLKATGIAEGNFSHSFIRNAGAGLPDLPLQRHSAGRDEHKQITAVVIRFTAWNVLEPRPLIIS